MTDSRDGTREPSCARGSRGGDTALRRPHGTHVDRRRAAYAPRSPVDSDGTFHVLSPDDPAFPRPLLAVQPQPNVLYARGDLTVLGRLMVAIVGSRTPSPYGVRVAYHAAYEAARAGLVVVSGLARGLDARAHRGALAAGGQTVAVLGTGLDVCYPRANLDLLDAIPKSGLLLTELPPGAPPRQWTFPARNRLIAGLAKCLLVVEGRETGGTNNSVWWMTKLGKTVLAVPGRIDEEVATGPNRLIADGATPYRSPQDLLDEFGIRWDGTMALLPPERSLGGAPRGSTWTACDPSVAPPSRLGGAPPPSRDGSRTADDLDLDDPVLQAAFAETGAAEATVYDLVTPEPVHVDRLQELSKLEPGLLLAVLSTLEIKGLVTQLPGKHFRLAS